MRSAQMCRIMLAVSLTFTLFQPLRAAAQESPSPTYTLPPKDYEFHCKVVGGEVVGPCKFYYGRLCDADCPTQGPYACTEKGPFNKYTEDREAKIVKLQGQLLFLAADEGIQRRKMQQAQHEIDFPTTNPALTAAQFAYAEADKKLKKDILDSALKRREIEALKDEMKETEASYNQTVTSNKVQCKECKEGFYLDPTGKCQCTTERQNRAIEENLRGGPAWQTVCGGGQSR